MDEELENKLSNSSDISNIQVSNLVNSKNLENPVKPAILAKN